MKLSKKTLIYSSIISVIMVSLIVGYFILMLPSLYVAHMQERNYDSIVELQQGYMRAGSYEKLKVKNPTATLTIEIPLTGNAFFITNKFFGATVEVKDHRLQDMLQKLRYYSKHTDEMEELNWDDFNPEELMEEFITKSEWAEDYPVELKFEAYESADIYKSISSKVHMESDDLFVYEVNNTDGQNYITNYIAMGLTEQAINITFMTVMTPRMEEIKPVIFQSLPMIVAVALLLILVSSQLFSRTIINPIIKLANHAKVMKEAKNLRLEPIILTGQDEISSLGESLNGLYQKIQDSYQELEFKNNYLAEENKRQEVFLRASSHQLKTPITAALLLVQGMISEVGKYKDVNEYLPQVKLQLLSMQKIVEDILYLNHCSENLQIESIMLSELMEECINAYQIQIEEKKLTVSSEGQSVHLETDRELLKVILNNLLSNAIHYSPEGGRIKITYEEHRLCIINYYVTIGKELLLHVFDPFVTGSSTILNNNDYSMNHKAHGLGLYVVSYYAKLLHYKVKLDNIDNGVMAELIFIG